MSVCKPIGPLSGIEIKNTGDLGALEDALCLWVSGDIRAAEPHLLALAEVAMPFAYSDAPRLYRGLVLPHTNQEFVTINRESNQILTSWSLYPEEVESFMSHRWEDWIMISAPATDLDIFINLHAFDESAKPAKKLRDHAEVIVKMPEKMRIHRSECAFYSGHLLSCP